MSDALIVFLKRPRAGETKTRLAPLLGAADAAALSRALAEALLRRTRPGRYRRVVYFAPAGARAEIAAWLPGEALEPQRGADLGARMAAAFDEVFASGARRAAIVGSDLPRLDAAAVEAALDGLEDADAVIGPARDGGYYMLALARPAPGLFDGIPWSTGAVLEETLARAARLGLRTRLLEPLRDVDTPEDLRAVWPGLAPLVDPELRERIARALAGAPGR